MQHIHPLSSVIPPETPLEVLIATAFLQLEFQKSLAVNISVGYIII
jgi:hypothetical protein